MVGCVQVWWGMAGSASVRHGKLRRLRWGTLGSGMVGSGQAWRLWFVAKVAVGGFWCGWARLVSAVEMWKVAISYGLGW